MGAILASMDACCQVLGMDGPHLLRVVAELGCLLHEHGRRGTGGRCLVTDLSRQCPALCEVTLHVLRYPSCEQSAV